MRTSLEPSVRPAGDAEVGSIELAHALRLSIARLARLLRQQDRTGLGPTVISALASINRCGGLTHGELAAMEQLAPPTITAVVAKLEGLGFVSRETDGKDRRVTRLRISAAGVEQLEVVRNRRMEWLEGQLRALTDDELIRLSDAADVLAKLAELAEPPPLVAEPIGSSEPSSPGTRS